MFIGKTHSGKTTFAKELEKIKNDVLVLEVDPVALFMRENFPKLRELDDKEHSGAFQNASLKYRIFLLLLEFSMFFGRTIILSNSNMYERGRKLVFKLAKNINIKLLEFILIFLKNFSLTELKNRKGQLKYCEYLKILMSLS